SRATLATKPIRRRCVRWLRLLARMWRTPSGGAGGAAGRPRGGGLPSTVAAPCVADSPRRVLLQCVRQRRGGVRVSAGLDLDLDADTGRELDALQRLDRRGVRVDDVDQPLVDAHLEVLARVLV